MADVFSSEQRRLIMARVKNKDTAPEKTVRSLLHRLGYRFRLHRKDLPGSPDIVFPGRKKVIFIHGCFWHGHPGCRRAARPTTNMIFWDTKLNRNMQRDQAAQRTLTDQGWQFFILWQCELSDVTALQERVVKFLS